MNIKSKQRGITFLGFIILMAVLAFFVATALAIYPLYYEKYQVVASLETVVNRPDADKLSTSEVRKYFMRGIALTNIKRFNKGVVNEHLKVLKAKKGQPKQVRLKYEARNNYFKDLYFVLDVEEYRPLGN